MAELQRWQRLWANDLISLWPVAKDPAHKPLLLACLVRT